jgi:hypothetical protein
MQQVKTENRVIAPKCGGCDEKCPVGYDTAWQLLTVFAEERKLSVDDAIKCLVSFYRKVHAGKREFTEKVLGRVDY